MVFKVAAELPTELPRLLAALGVETLFMPLPDMMTEDAGELPGVSTALPVAGLSIVIMLDIESRNCWLALRLRSSSNPSMTFMLALRASSLDSMSESNLRTSPFTVSLSLTPFCMIETTLSIAGV